MAKKKTGRSSTVSRAVGKKGTGKFKRSTGRMASVSRRSGPPPTSGHELVPVICSECFEEFSFDTGVKTETLVCPVCEHSASRPDDATLHRISTLRSQERFNFMITFGLTLVGLAAFGTWAVLITNPLNSTDSAMFWGPIGVALLSALVLIVFIFRYEGNRWETYF